VVERALQIAEGDVGVDTETFDLMKDGRMGCILRIVAMHLAGNYDADRGRVQFHGAHLHRRGVCAEQKSIAQRPAFLVGDDERVLRVARRMAGGEVHALKVVEVGFYLGADADRIAQRGKDLRDFVERARDRVFRADKPLGAGQRDVDCFSSEGGIGWAGAESRLEQAFHEFLQCLKSFAYGLLGIRRSSLEPAAGNFIEQALLAAQPFEAEGFNGVGTSERGRVLASLLLDRGEGFVERGPVEGGQIGNGIVRHA